MSKACCDATCGTTTAPPPGPFSYEVVLAACDASDARQRWSFGARGEAADVKNAGTCTCLEGIDTAPAKTATCLATPGSGEFTWRAGGSLAVTGGLAHLGWCLDARDNATVALRRCDGSGGQAFRVSGGTAVAWTGACVATGSGTDE